jgi:hypothetical protein
MKTRRSPSVPRLGRALPLALALIACDEGGRPATLGPALSGIKPAPPLPEVGPIERLVDGAAPSAIARRGELAYVTDGHGLTVYQILENGRVERKYHTPTPGNASGLAIAGSTLYVADGRSGLARFSLDTPDRPALLGHFAMRGAVRQVFGSELGAAALVEGGSIAIVRPGRAVLELSLPGEPRGAAWLGRDIYIADTGDGLLRVEIDPEPARVALRDRSFRFAISVAAHAGRLLVGHQDKRVELLDVSGPAPAVLDSVEVDHLPAQLFVLDNHVIVAGREDRGKGATLIEIVPPASLEVRGKEASLVAGAARAHGSQALVAQGGAGSSVVSLEPFGGHRAIIEEGLALNRVSGGDSVVLAWGGGREGTLAWQPETGAPKSRIEGDPIHQAIPCGEALCALLPGGQLCHQSPPDKPGAQRACSRVAEGGLAIAWQPEASRLWLLDASGGLQGFVTAGAEGFRRVAVAPRPPTVTRESLERLVVEGDRAAAIDPSLGLMQVFSLGDSPRRRGAFLLQASPSAIALANGVALVATRSGLQVIEITDADRPAEIGWIPRNPGPLGVAALWPRRREAREARVALAEGEDGFSLWTWDGRGALSAIARSDTTGVASDAAFAGGSLWVADGTGLVRCRLSQDRP